MSCDAKAQDPQYCTSLLRDSHSTVLLYCEREKELNRASLTVGGFPNPLRDFYVALFSGNHIVTKIPTEALVRFYYVSLHRFTVSVARESLLENKDQINMLTERKTHLIEFAAKDVRPHEAIDNLPYLHEFLPELEREEPQNYHTR
jgi:hypothetical protein